MKISPDDITIYFKTESEELFAAERSGAKSNTVRILNGYDYRQLVNCDPKKIIIQHRQEAFLRTITHIHVENILGKVIAIFSWTNEDHHHTISNETGRDPYAHTMSLDEQEPFSPLKYQAINVSLPLLKRLDLRRGDDTYDEFISKLLDDYKTSPHMHTMPQDPHFEEHIAAGTAPTTEEEAKKLALIGISKGMADILVRLAYNRSMDTVIRELYQLHLDKRAEERGPLHD